MPDAEKFLKWLLLTAGIMLEFLGIFSLIDVKRSLVGMGVVVMGVSEANAHAAVYGGLFLALALLCFYARERTDDKELAFIIGIAFLITAATRIYAAGLYGMPDAPRIYVNFCVELFFGAAISITARLSPAQKSQP